MMILLNFSHPITPAQLDQVHALLGNPEEPLRLVEMPVQHWASWVIYLLEVLDNSVRQAGDFDAVLEAIETAIAIRRAGGSW